MFHDKSSFSVSVLIIFHPELSGKSCKPAVEFQPVGTDDAVGSALNVSVGKEPVESRLMAEMVTGIRTSRWIIGFFPGIGSGVVDGIHQHPVG